MYNNFLLVALLHIYSLWLRSSQAGASPSMVQDNDRYHQALRRQLTCYVRHSYKPFFLLFIGCLFVAVVQVGASLACVDLFTSWHWNAV